MTTENVNIKDWFVQYADRVYAFICYKVGNDKQMASDILQETFLTALKQKQQYKAGRATPLSWLILQSRNHIKSAIRQNKKFANIVDNDPDALLPSVFEKIDTALLPDDVLERKETAELVHITMAGMTEKHKNCLEQFYNHGKTIEQIANENNQSQILVRVTLHRARNAFKKNFLKTAKSLLLSEITRKGNR